MDQGGECTRPPATGQLSGSSAVLCVLGAAGYGDVSVYGAVVLVHLYQHGLCRGGSGGRSARSELAAGAAVVPHAGSDSDHERAPRIRHVRIFAGTGDGSAGEAYAGLPPERSAASGGGGSAVRGEHRHDARLYCYQRTAIAESVWKRTVEKAAAAGLSGSRASADAAIYWTHDRQAVRIFWTGAKRDSRDFAAWGRRSSPPTVCFPGGMGATGHWFRSNSSGDDGGFVVPVFTPEPGQPLLCVGSGNNDFLCLFSGRAFHRFDVHCPHDDFLLRGGWRAFTIP